MNSAHIHKHQHELDKDIEVLILKGNLHQKHERELWEDKFICLMGTKTPTGLNIELKHNGRELYKAFSYLFSFFISSLLLFNFPLRTFLVDTLFPVHILRIISTSEVFVENITL